MMSVTLSDDEVPSTEHQNQQYTSSKALDGISISRSTLLKSGLTSNPSPQPDSQLQLQEQVQPQASISNAPRKINRKCYKFYGEQFREQDKALRSKSGPFLKALPFTNLTGVSATVCKIGNSIDDANPRLGILWICNDREQKGYIENRLKSIGATFLRDISYHRVEIPDTQRTIRFASGDFNTPSQPGRLAGLSIKSNATLNPTTICGVLCVLNDPADEQTRPSHSTIGGTIRVGAEIFALTVAHLFLSDLDHRDYISSIKIQDVHELGKIESYEFGNSAEEKTAGHIDNDLEDSFDWDWAVIRISSGLHLPNSIGNLGTNSDDIVATVEDYVRSDDLTTGMVLIQSGMSGTQSGTLYADSILMLLEDKCLELMEIEMKHPLTNGDSGSWVIQNDKVCGYIVAIAVDENLAYMVLTHPVLQEITRVFSVKETITVDIPSSSTFIPPLETLEEKRLSSTSEPSRPSIRTQDETGITDTSSLSEDQERHDTLGSVRYEKYEDARLLPDKSTDSKAEGKLYGNTLKSASIRGDLATVQRLLKQGADVNAQRGDYNKSHGAASFRGRRADIRWPFWQGPDVTTEATEYANALQAASWEGHTDIVKLLLGHGANVNAQGGEYGNALKAAS